MKVLLFDIDGTLIRGGGCGRKALNEAAYTLYGRRNACSELALAGRTDLYNFSATYRNATGKRPTAAAVERLHQEYLRCLPRHVKSALRTRTYHIPPGLKTLLKRLSRESDVLLGLGTGNMERGARIKLEPSGFNAYFLFGGYGSDAFHRHQLLKKGVARAKKLAHSSFTAKDVFIIGDTPFDVFAGKKAGYKTIAVGTGYSAWKELVASRPDHLAKDFRKIKKWLSWLELN
jgi:phosphoglycolate phosphatase-like HAD superfamily hydrolase